MFKRGDRVRIKDGPFENMVGIVDEIFPALAVVRVLVEIFGRPTPLELGYDQLEKTEG